MLVAPTAAVAGVDDGPLGVGIGLKRVLRGARELVNLNAVVVEVVGDVELAADLVIRGEGHAEQPLLGAVVLDLIFEVEKRLLELDPVVEHDHVPVLGGDVQQL